MNTENSISILKFMGYEVINYQHNVLNPIYSGHNSLKTVGEFKKLWGGLDTQVIGRFTNAVNFPFDSEWDYLMPVVEKIEALNYGVRITRTTCFIDSLSAIPEFKVIGGFEETKIKAVYNACVGFINWHNEQKK